jgi:phosphotriesterase-related protein
MKLVRTVLGDVDAAGLGLVLAHEHLIIDSPIVANEMPHIHLPSTEEAAAEARLMVDAGVGTVVDAMPSGSGGDIDRLVEVSRATGLNIVASTGMHTSRYYDGVDWHLTASPDELARAFSVEITGTSPRAGLIKIATIGSEPNDHERRLFEAAAIAMAATGVPVLTHCEGGEGGLAQIDLMASLGMPLARVAMSHTDKVIDRAYHRDLADTGVMLCLDQGLREPERTADLVTSLLADGFASQLLIGTDAARRTLWATLGGPGPGWIISSFKTTLLDRGLGQGQIDLLFVDNPSRWLTLAG